MPSEIFISVTALQLISLEVLKIIIVDDSNTKINHADTSDVERQNARGKTISQKDEPYEFFYLKKNYVK